MGLLLAVAAGDPGAQHFARGGSQLLMGGLEGIESIQFRSVACVHRYTISPSLRIHLPGGRA